MIRCPPRLQWDQARSPAAVTPDDVRSVSRLIAHTDDALRVAEPDGKLVGAPIAAWDGWRGNMYRLAVLPTFADRSLRQEPLTQENPKNGRVLIDALSDGSAAAYIGPAVPLQ
jgi:hypothetical protein